MPSDLARRAVSECVATAFLLMAIVGSGIMSERLAGGNVGLALITTTIAIGAALVAIILTFGPISGAQINPAVTLVVALERGLPWRDVPWFLAAQIVGAFAGVAITHVMFGEPLFVAGTQVRAGLPQLVSEFVATFGLIAVVWGCGRRRPDAISLAVGAYITAAIWFTASTAFANPAVTLARAATNTFTSIRPVDAPGFVIAELLGAVAATLLFRWLTPPADAD